MVVIQAYVFTIEGVWMFGSKGFLRNLGHPGFEGSWSPREIFE